ncbi:MAG TPA: exosortase Q [Albitalea sp.]|nr:exosortase Q [Albitalea sp.]
MQQVIATHWRGRWQCRIDAVPPLAWLAAQAAALWPHWRWAAARLLDGSDDPLGLAALAALLWAALRLAPALRAEPHPRWGTASLGLTLAATLASLLAPPLLGALLAALAMACGLRAFMPAGQPGLPLAGLALLSLPVLSSLQFYAGYPLRVLTAQASTWILQALGMQAERSGSAMLVDGQLVIVDAPCSGVQMAWLAYFAACAVAAFTGLADRRFMARLPWVGLIVLTGNVVRNSALVALDAGHHAVSELVHQGIGLAVLALVCAAVVGVMRGGRDAH